MSRRKRMLEELEQDIGDHIATETRDNIARGMPPEEARYAALRKFGNVTRVREETREVWQLSWLEHLRQDLSYAVRMLRKSPGFTVVAVLTLALGIGANTAIFSIVNAVLLKDLPVKDPAQLVFLTNPDNQGGEKGFQDGDREWLTYPEFQDLERNNQVFSGMLAASSFTAQIPVTLEGETIDEPTPGQVSLVSGSYFSVLGVNPILGRVFTTEVDRVRDANPVAVISYRFWQSRRAGDPAILRRKLRILNTAYDIVGVAPQQFRGETVGSDPDIWVPLTMQSEIFPGRDYISQEELPFQKTEFLQVMGRLKPGVTVTQAAAQVNVAFQQIMQSQTAGMSADDTRRFLNQHLAVTEGNRGASTLRDHFGKPLQILMAVVGLILLIACANIANILLARSAARQKEIAVRVAMGARASRIFRQLLTESVLLALIGGTAGLFLAHWADHVLLRMASGGSTAIPLDVHPDARILGFTMGISLLVGVLFGLAPAIRSFSVDLSGVLKGTSRAVAAGATRGGRFRVGKILVIAQVALSLVLLAVAALFVRSFRNLAEVELGFDRDRLLLFDLSPLSYGYETSRIPRLYQEILERVKAVPGVDAATICLNAPFRGFDANSPVFAEGDTPRFDDLYAARWDMVGPEFFSTVGIPILIGRPITTQDNAGGQRAGVVNQSLASKYFGKANPIGKRMIVQTTFGQADFVIVGVAANSRHGSVREEFGPRFYVSFFNPIGDAWASRATILIRTAKDASSTALAVRATVKQAAGSLPPVDITTINQLVAESLTSDSLVTQLSGAFGVLAVILVSIGLYGIMAYSVSGRINEMGIRIALGARRANVLWLVLRESSMLVLLGIAIALPILFAVRKWITSLLFGVKPGDPLILALTVGFMFVVGLFACYVPARRAMLVDPMIALRYE